MSKDLNFLAIFALFGKPTLMVVFTILFRKFLPPHRSTLLCWNVVKNFSDGKSLKLCVILPPKKFRLSLKLMLLRG